jgi:hypothetical protein
MLGCYNVLLRYDFGRDAPPAFLLLWSLDASFIPSSKLRAVCWKLTQPLRLPAFLTASVQL